MLAEDTSSRIAESSARREVPVPSPILALMSIVKGRGELLLLFLAGAVDGLGLDDFPIFFLVLETAPADLRLQLLAEEDPAQPVGVTIIGVDCNPGELGAHTLVPNH